MSGWLIAELDILCLIMCQFVFIKEMINSNERLIKNRHERLLLTSMLFIVCDMLYLLIENGNLPQNKALAFAVNIGYYAFLVYDCAMWSNIVDGFLGKHPKPTELGFYLRLIPPVIFMILLFLTPVTGWIFTIDINCEFERGPLNFLLFVLCYGYLIISTVRLATANTRSKSLVYRHRRNNMLLFPLPLFVCSVVQLFFPQVSITPIGLTMSLLLNYEMYRRTIASVDSLTQIRNRTSMLYYMEDLVQKDPTFCCMMIDIDGFKGVNDTYGHVTGDILLRSFGSTLGKTAERFGMAAARYAGDEFLVVCRSEDASSIPLFWSEFEAELESVKIPNTEKSVGASMGYAFMKPEYASMHELISRCDTEMYLNKNEKKKRLAESGEAAGA